MTSNQIAAKQLKETERANRAKEAQNEATHKLEKSKAAETRRSNKANESIGRGRASHEAFKSVATSAKDILSAVGTAYALGNDPAWYAENPQALKDAGSYSFNNPIGIPYYLKNTVYLPGRGPADTEAEATIPGVLRLKVVNCPGLATGNPEGTQPVDIYNSAVNTAARNLYSYVRYANSGSRNYESSDLMMYILAMDNVVSWYATMRRLYGTAMIYDQYNRYWPDALIKAQGFDPENIRRNAVQLRWYINTFAQKAGALFIPGFQHYFARHMQIYTNIYSDSNYSKDQCYVLTPYGYHYFGIDSDTGAGKLIYEICPNDMTIDDIISIGDKMLNAIMANEDFGIMGGDILKAFGPDKMLTLTSVPEDYQVEIGYNEEMAIQIRNATIMPRTGPVVPGSFDVTQIENTIYFNPRLSLPSSLEYYIRREDMLNLYHGENTVPENTMVATRLKTLWNVSGATPEAGDYYYPTSLGSEFVLQAEMYYRTRNGLESKTVAGIEIFTFNNDGPASGSVEPVKDILNFLFRYVQFDNRPNVGVLFDYNTGDSDSDSAVCLGTFQDLDNFTVITGENLRKMNETAVLSEFGVPFKP